MVPEVTETLRRVTVHTEIKMKTKTSYKSSGEKPAPPVPSQPAKLNKPTQTPAKCLDPSWYGAQLTRRQAEAVLRAVSKDGAFLVRDSSKTSSEHPYTLMSLHQGKIYNIRIRHLGNSYLLGIGLNKTESFPGLKEMIIHHTSNPLLLTDAKDRHSAGL
nr:lymphocyte cytosolic protein 2-like [Nothobranchius furzeri]